MTKVDIPRLRALMEEATPGRWSRELDRVVAWPPDIGGFQRVFEDVYNDADAELVVALVNNAPALLDEVEALRAEVEGYRARQERYEELERIRTDFIGEATCAAREGGFLGVPTETLWCSEDVGHYLAIVRFAFPDDSTSLFVTAWEAHDDGGPARLMPLSAVVHLMQNVGELERYQIANRDPAAVERAWPHVMDELP